MTRPDSLASYYGKRAADYDRIYEKPERQQNLATLKEILRGTFQGKKVLEIACGTGYWTQILAEVAHSVLAVDINNSVMEIARQRVSDEHVLFRSADAYTLEDLGAFDADEAFAGFWWSHIPRARITEFLKGLHARLAPGASVLLLDNRYVEGSSTPLSRRDEEGNTYQVRKLDDGTSYEVLKNFPSEQELRDAVEIHGGQGVEVRFFEYYWTLSYKLAAN